jgi:hypothetical protein
VTEILATSLASVFNVKGCIYRKVVPNVSEAADWYQPVNEAVRSTVAVVVLRLFPGAAVKVNVAEVMLRVGDRPIIAVLIDVPLRVSATLLMTGGPAGTETASGTRLAGVTLVPPATSWIVNVIVPAVDPDEKSMAGMGVLLFAGIWMTSVVVLLGNKTVGSLTVFGAVGVKARVRVAVIGTGYGSTVSVTDEFCPGVAIADALAWATAVPATIVNVAVPNTAIFPGSVTVIVFLPEVVRSAAGTVAVSWPRFTQVVAKGEPFQFTMAPLMNPCPVTVMVAPPVPPVATDGEILLRLGAATVIDCDAVAPA